MQEIFYCRPIWNRAILDQIKNDDIKAIAERNLYREFKRLTWTYETDIRENMVREVMEMTAGNKKEKRKRAIVWECCS